MTHSSANHPNLPSDDSACFRGSAHQPINTDKGVLEAQEKRLHPTLYENGSEPLEIANENTLITEYLVDCNDNDCKNYAVDNNGGLPDPHRTSGSNKNHFRERSGKGCRTNKGIHVLDNADSSVGSSSESISGVTGEPPEICHREVKGLSDIKTSG